VDGSYVGQSSLLNGAAGDRVLLVHEGVYEEDCPKVIYDSRIEGFCEEEAAVLKEVNVGTIESKLLHPIPIQRFLTHARRRRRNCPL
jgi:hypothetical protein